MFVCGEGGPSLSKSDWFICFLAFEFSEKPLAREIYFLTCDLPEVMTTELPNNKLDVTIKSDRTHYRTISFLGVLSPEGRFCFVY